MPVPARASLADPRRATRRAVRLLAGLLFTLGGAAIAAQPPPGGWPAPPSTGTVVSVYDGDTFTLATGDKIRLKWVNTPEMKPEEPYAADAKRFTDAFVNGREVTLIVDPRDARDGYGRILAGVRTPEGDLSEALLRAGYGHLFVIPPDSTDLTKLVAAQEEARAARRGIWGADGFTGPMHITSLHANAPGDDRTNVNGEYMRICNVSAAPVDLDGWRLVDVSGGTHRLPHIVVPIGNTVQVMSGVGTTGPRDGGQLEVYLGSTEPLWNNTFEVIELFDAQGVRVDRREHKGSGE